MEAELAENIVEHSRRHDGMFINDVCKLAYKLCIVNCIEIKTNNDKMMSMSWYYKFMRKNPKLSLRKAENTSIARTVFQQTDNRTFF